jgi:NitT/TauT family transport system permease protein
LASIIDLPPVTAPERPARRRSAVLRWIAGAGFAVGRRSVAIAAFLTLWEVAPRAGWVDHTFLPPFSDDVAALWDLAGSGQLWSNTEQSLARALTGFVIAIVVAVPVGLLIGWYRWVDALLDPLLEVFRNTAALALLPVFILLLGIGETSKISIVVYACVWPILLNTVAAVSSVDPTLIKSAKSLGLSAPRIFQKVILPASVPTVFTGIRMAGSSSILVLIAAEMVGAKAGLGYLINASQQNFAIADMYAGIITISVLGTLFNYLLVLAERRLTRWQIPVGT